MLIRISHVPEITTPRLFRVEASNNDDIDNNDNDNDNDSEDFQLKYIRKLHRRTHSHSFNQVLDAIRVQDGYSTRIGGREVEG
jgi:hypothetical protein